MALLLRPELGWFKRETIHLGLKEFRIHDLCTPVQCSPTVQISDFIIYIVSLQCRYWRKVIIIVISL